MLKYCRLLLTLLLYVAISFSILRAQTFVSSHKTKSSDKVNLQNLQGRIIDGSSKKPLKYAVVKARKSGSGELLMEEITNGSGRFTLKGLPLTGIEIEVQALGFVAKKISHGQSVKRSIDLGKLALIPKKRRYENEGVATSGGKTLSVDHQVYYPRQLSDNPHHPLPELLRSIPGFYLDRSNNVSLWGNSRVRFLVDGKLSNLTDQNLMSLFQEPSTPSIKRIQVSTSPRTDYQSADLSGIVNVSLRDNKIGWNGVFDLGYAGENRHRTGFEINYNSKKFILNSGLRVSRIHLDGYGKLYRWEDTTSVHTTIDQEYRHDQINFERIFDLNLTYKPNANTSLSFESTYHQPWVERTTTTDSEILNKTGSVARIQDQRITNLDSRDRDWRSGLWFDKVFSSARHRVSAGVAYESGKVDQLLNFQNATFDMDGLTLLEILDLSQSHILGDHMGLRFELNYLQPFRRGEGFLEFGWKSSERRFGSNFNRFNFNYFSDMFFEVPPLNNRYRYKEQVHSFYSSIILPFREFELLLRLETEQLNTAFTTASVDPGMERNFFNLLPTIQVSYPLKNKTKLFIKFHRELLRPTQEELNPFIDFTNLFYLKSGDPFLFPQTKNLLKASYERHWEEQKVTGSLYYESTQNAVLSILQVAPPNIALLHFKNIKARKDLGLEVHLQFKFAKIVEGQLTSQFFNRRLVVEDPEIGFTNNLWSWQNEWELGANLWEQATFKFTGTHRGKVNTPQGTLDPLLIAGFQLDLQVASDRFGFSIGTDDLFNSNRIAKTTAAGDFIQIDDYRENRRLLFFNAVFNFGSSRLRRSLTPLRMDR